MNLGVIDKDEYRQYRYWQIFQKLLLPCAAGFSVAGVLLNGPDLRLLSRVVGLLLWALFAATAVTGWLVSRHMVRGLPPSLQSLLLFSSESDEDVRTVVGGDGDRLVSADKAAAAE